MRNTNKGVKHSIAITFDDSILFYKKDLRKEIFSKNIEL